MREIRLRRGDVEIHTVEWPPGQEANEPPVLLLHGLSSNSYFWSRIAERLPWRRVVAIDQRAHGASSAPATGYQPAELAADAAEAVAERKHYIGHVWGADLDRFVEHGLVRDGNGWRLPLTEKIRFEIL